MRGSTLIHSTNIQWEKKSLLNEVSLLSKNYIRTIVNYFGYRINFYAEQKCVSFSLTERLTHFYYFASWVTTSDSSGVMGSTSASKAYAS